jgi:predicted metal-dependent hydrolase
MSFVKLKDQEVPVIYHKKRTKHSYIRVKDPGILHVTVGRYATRQMMQSLIGKNADSLLKQVNRFAQEKVYTIFGQEIKQVLREQDGVYFDEVNKILYLPKNQSKEALKAFEKNLLLNKVNQILEEFPHKDLISIEGLTISTRYTRTVNGSCNARKRRINLNLFLIRKPVIFLQYVLMHELAHLKVQNHSKAFYQVLEVLCPKYKEIKKAMRLYEG